VYPGATVDSLVTEGVIPADRHCGLETVQKSDWGKSGVVDCRATLVSSKSVSVDLWGEIQIVSLLYGKLVACRGANITRLRIWSPKRYLLNQLHSSINSVALPPPQ
jgi:hypothetical protein